MAEPWTPGPWTVEDDSGAAFDDTWWVAGPSWLFDGNNNVAIDNEADARLIALAPEMAELLGRVLDELEGAAVEVYGSDPHPLVVEGRDLLARARGER